MADEKNILPITILIIGLSSFIIILFSNFIFADILVSPVSFTFNEDVSYAYNITVNNTGVGQEANITVVNITLPSGFTFNPVTNASTIGAIFSNTSDGAIILTWTNVSGSGPLINGTYNQTFTFNATMATPGTYNFTITTVNGTGSYWQNLTVTISDTNFPNITSVIAPVWMGNYSGLLVVNVSITEDVPSLVYFNLTTSAGAEVVGFWANSTASRIGSSTYWNYTINTSLFADGVYNLTTYMNDTSNQITFNGTTTFRIDNTAPNLSSIVTPVVSGNYTGILTLNISVGDGVLVQSVVFNVTNSSGGVNGTFTALSDTGTFWNTTLDTSTYIEGLYNVTAYVTDFAGNLNGTAVVRTFRIDNTAPNLSSVITPVTSGNYTGILTLNISVGDGVLVQSVVFNVTNSSGGVNGTFTALSDTGTFWNTTLDTSTYIDGLYNVTAYVTDFAGNLNGTTVVRTFRVDNINPTNTLFYCTPTSVYVGDTVTCTCDSAADSGSGLLSTVFTENPSTTTTGTKTETCTMTDRAGNIYAPTTTYTVTTRPSGGSAVGGGGGSSSRVQWSMTYKASDEQLTAGYTKSMKIKERVEVKINGEEGHYVGIKSVTLTSATIEIASDPIIVELDIGEDVKVDVNDDGIYDVYVVLNGISNGKAEITIKKIMEVIPEGVEEAVVTTGEIVTPEEVVPEEPKRNYNWLWIVGIIIILVAIGYKYKDQIKKKKKKKK